MSTSKFYQSGNTTLYESEIDGKKTLIKTIAGDTVPKEQIQRFENEYEQLSSIDIPGVRKVIKKDTYNDKPALWLEFVDAITLDEFTKNGTLEIEKFLHLAIKLTGILGELHSQGIIHKDINGSNILIDKLTEFPILIDFDTSSRINIKTQHLGNPEKLEGTLTHISPEQTGRMNRVVDHRTDIYSLGVTFYKILTSKLPFESEDAMELIHAHMAKAPVPIHKLNNEIPAQLSKIIAKMLVKNAEGRYQSALGLQHDLELSLKNLSQGEIIEFDLGKEDFAGIFSIPEKLYGRNAEVEVLLGAFDKICTGSNLMVMVGGYSGTGKSALVYEIHKPITGKRGYFIDGKFDQYQRNIPYYAIIQAFKDFIDLLLMESEEQLSDWKSRILSAVGDLGKVITELIPSLELVIGEQPEVSPLSGAEAQNRFNYVFQSFVQAIADERHPLVLFIDDLQWADQASLNLIQGLMSNDGINYLLLIGAFRDNEVNESHPFILTVNEIEKHREIDKLKINNLSLEHINELVSETLITDPKRSLELSKLIHQKTEGNAFFVNQFLKSLYEESHITFDHTAKRWTWDMDQITGLNITDNVVELMTTKVSKLPEASLKVLKNASCIGNRFDLKTLSVISEQTPVQTAKQLWQAVTEGLILPVNDNYKLVETNDLDAETIIYAFIHDRVQQSAYQLIEEENRDPIHYQIGKLLFKVNENEWEDHVFDIVNQWNRGIEFISDEAEKDQLLLLNLEAGNKARESAAYSSAINYFETSLNLRSNLWQVNYDRALETNNLLAESYFLNGDQEQATDRIQQILKNANSTLDKVFAYDLKMTMQISKQELENSLVTGIEILAELGVKFPKKPKLPHILLGVVRSKLLMIGKTPESLMDLPEMTNPNTIAALPILARMINPAYIANMNLFPLVIIKMFVLSVKHGNSPLSGIGYLVYAALVGGKLEDIPSGISFGELGMNFQLKHGEKSLLGRAQFLHISFSTFYNTPMRVDKSVHLMGFKNGLESGDIEYAGLNYFRTTFYGFFAGENLTDLFAKAQNTTLAIDQLKQDATSIWSTTCDQTIFYMQNRPKVFKILSGTMYDEKIARPRQEEQWDNLGIYFLILHKLILNIYYKKFNNAAKFSFEIQDYIDYGVGIVEMPLMYYYSTIALSLALPELPSKYKSKAKKLCKKHIKKLKNHTKFGPMNFEHKALLAEALFKQQTSPVEKVIQLFDQAIEKSKEHKYQNDYALALELKGNYYLTQNQEEKGKYFMQEAFKAYKSWEAFGKLEQLQEEFPQYFTSLSNNTASDSVGNQLDLSTVIKASQTLSGEIKLEKLMGKMMQILIENAGADYGVLVENREGELLVQAQWSTDEDLQTNMNEKLDESEKLSLAMVHYVQRSNEIIVLDDAMSSNYSTDDYISKKTPKSILCFPIINKGELKGVVYLENNLTTGAFTKDRLEVLNMLSSQLAISLENAFLYENLEAKVEERTAEVEAQKLKLEKQANTLQEANNEISLKNEHITSSIAYAKTIQQAVLPDLGKMKSYFEDAFVLYKPKDVVSGDFYWYSHINGDTTPPKTIIAAVDCTGHGVPGAFMSMIGNTLLNEIVNQKRITKTDEILEELNRRVRESLRQSEKKNNDGMDMCLCCIEQEGDGFKLSFTGAKRPLYVFNSRTEKLEVIEGDRKSIGGIKENDKRFTSQEINVSKGTNVYLTTDGFADQNNMERRKFGTKNLKELLTKVSGLSGEEQLKSMQQRLKQHQRGANQRDDITLIGLKL